MSKSVYDVILEKHEKKQSEWLLFSDKTYYLGEEEAEVLILSSTELPVVSSVDEVFNSFKKRIFCDEAKRDDGPPL